MRTFVPTTLSTLLLLATLPDASPGQRPDPGTEAYRADTAAPPFVVRRVGRGRPMILIPGLASSGEVWDATAARYRERYELHVLTLAGFAGVPPVAADPFLRRQRDAILQYIRDHRLERPVLVGHSLGAFLAFWVAATAPEAVGPVVAVDGVPFLVALTDTAATEATMAPQAAQARAFYASMTPQQMEAQSRMAAATMVADSALAARIGRWGGASDPSTVGRAVAEMLTTDLRDEVAAIRTPVLLLAAGAGRPADGRARLEASYRAQLRAVPDAAVVVAERARHFIMYDDPEFFFRTLDRFLDRR